MSDPNNFTKLRRKKKKKKNFVTNSCPTGHPEEGRRRGHGYCCLNGGPKPIETIARNTKAVDQEGGSKYALQ